MNTILLRLSFMVTLLLSISQFSYGIPIQYPTIITTHSVSGISSSTATGNGNITDLGGANITERGIYYSTTDGFADGAGTKVSTTGDWSSTGAFAQAIMGLTAETTYYVKAFAANSEGTSYGSQISFTTSAASSTCTITSNDETISSGFTTPTVIWNVGNSFTACQDGIISKIKVLSVDSQTGVTMKVYEGNGVGGNLLQTITGIALNEATTITDYTVIDVSSYNIPVTNSSQYTFYFSDAKVRIYFNQTNSMLAGGAYWINDGGIQEVPTRDLYFEIDFGQGASNTAPTAASFTASPIYEGITYAFATANFGYSDGDSDPIDHVRVTAVPTNGTLWVDADGSGTVNGAESALANNGTISKANLDAGYLKYLNTNGASSSFTFDVNDGTDYSASTYSATLTVTANSAPTVSTTASSSISTTSATLGGNVTSDGGATVTERGVVYSTTDATPTIAEGATKDINGSGIGTFSESIGSLSVNTTYYYNAYAINVKGTSYGTASSFTTLKLSQTITFNALSDKAYGSADYSPGATASSELDVTYTSSNESVATIVDGQIHMVGAGTAIISANQSGNATYAAAEQVNQVLTVDQAELIVTADNKAKIYGEANPALTVAYSGFVNSEDSTVLTTLPTAACSADEITGAGSASITASGGVADNYIFNYVDGALSINKAELTVTADDQAKTYGEANPALTVSYSGFVNSEDSAVLTTLPTAACSADETTGAGSASITASGGVADNYSFKYVDGALSIGKATASVILESLSATYDGNAKAATTTTNPTGLSVDFTYDGEATAPTNAGTYAVVGTINNANYTGSANGSLVIGKATATVTLGSLSATYDGEAKAASATTSPADLSVEFTYDGEATAPTNAGTYAVVATINNANYTGSANGSLVIGKATATVTLGSLSATYDGEAKAASATTSPADLSVEFTYDGEATAPTNAGTYAVVGTINNANYTGSANGSLVIGKATATVTLGSLSATYDGEAKAASATTSPADLSVEFTYDGEATAPTNAGTYAVVGTINNANYQGLANGSLVIGKATATVTLGSLSATYDGEAKAASATTSPADLSVSFTYDGEATAPTNAGTYAVVGTINNANYQGSANGSLVIGKATPVVLSWPTVSDILEGDSIGSTELDGGEASVDGIFAFTDSSYVPEVDGEMVDLIFVPDENSNFVSVAGSVALKFAVATRMQNLCVDVNVYPTLGNGIVTLKVDNQSAFSCKVFDLSGKPVKEIRNNVSCATLNITDQAAGYYIVQIVQNGKIIKTSRIVKR